MEKKTPIIAASIALIAAAGALAVVVQRPDLLPQGLRREAPPAQQQAAVEPKKLEEPAAGPAQNQTAAPSADAQAGSSGDTNVVTQQSATAEQDVVQPSAEAVQQQLTPEPIQRGPVVPSFDTVRVEPTGEAVIAGRAAPGADIAIKFGNVVVGEVKAEADGSFVFVPEHPLPQGAGAITLESTQDGQKLVSKDAIAVVVTRKAPALVAKVDPKQPTKIVQTPGDVATGEPPKEVRFGSIDYNDKGDMIFQGVARPNATVRLYIDNDISGEVTADVAGNWRFDAVAPLKPGTHTLRADEVDASGKVTSRAETPFLREKPEKVIAVKQAEAEAAAEVAAAAAQEASAQPVPQPVEEAAVQPQLQTEPSQVVTAPAVETETAAAAPAAVQPSDVAATAQQDVAAASPADAVQPPAEEPGTEIAIAPAAMPGGPARVVIQPGNNLWVISQELYGEGKSYTVIFEANRDQIKDPNLVYPGQILSMPVAQN